MLFYNSITSDGLSQVILPYTHHCYYDCSTCGATMASIDYKTCDVTIL